MLRAHANSEHMEALNASIADGERAGSPALPAQQNAEEVSGAEQQNQLSVLRQKLDYLEAQSAQYKVQQESARRLYRDLQDEVKSLKSKNCNLTVLGHE